MKFKLMEVILMKNPMSLPVQRKVELFMGFSLKFFQSKRERSSEDFEKVRRNDSKCSLVFFIIVLLTVYVIYLSQAFLGGPKPVSQSSPDPPHQTNFINHTHETELPNLKPTNIPQNPWNFTFLDVAFLDFGIGDPPLVTIFITMQKL